MFGFKHGSKNLIRFVAKPTVTGAYTFDNSQKSAVITGYDAKAMTVSGTQQATSSGTYSITFTLNKGYAWEDKSKDAITLRWSIAKRTVSIPTMTNKSFTYAVNSTFAPTISGVNVYITQSGTASATNAGNYSVTWALVYPNDTVWSDNTTSNKSASWSVARRSITIPSMTNTSHTWAVNTTFKPTITGVDSTYVTQSGATSSTSAGSWTVTWSLKDTANTAWSDNTTGNKTASWSVAKRSITVPSITSGSFTWAVNKTFAPTITGVDSNYITQTGTVSSTNAGSWTVTWALKSTANTQWTDKTTANKTGTWSVAKLTLTIPSISSAKSFSFIEGTTRSVTVANYNSTYETQSGTASASALGTYTLKWVLKYPANTQWSGGTVTDKTASWTIVWTNGTSYYKNDIYDRGKKVPSRMEGSTRTIFNDANITSTDTVSSSGVTWYRYIIRFGTISAAGYTKVVIEGTNLSDHGTYQHLRYGSSWIDTTTGGSQAATSWTVTDTKITYNLKSAAISAGAQYWSITCHGSNSNTTITRIHFE